MDYLPTQFLQAFVYVPCGLFSMYLNHKNKNVCLFDGVKIHYFQMNTVILTLGSFTCFYAAMQDMVNYHMREMGPGF
jgi:hypothetical protein